MDLILWRHAEAHDAKAGQDDLTRELTSRGEKQAQRMAQWLNRYLPSTTRVLVSPARRTQQTAAALDRRFKTVETLAPGASVQAVLEAARWPENKEPVLVIGHQPALGLVAGWLLCAATQPLSVKKGAVWWLRQRDREGGGQVVLVTARGPDMP